MMRKLAMGIITLGLKTFLMKGIFIDAKLRCLREIKDFEWSDENLQTLLGADYPEIMGVFKEGPLVGNMIVCDNGICFLEPEQMYGGFTLAGYKPNPVLNSALILGQDPKLGAVDVKVTMETLADQIIWLETDAVLEVHAIFSQPHKKGTLFNF